MSIKETLQADLTGAQKELAATLNAGNNSTAARARVNTLRLVLSEFKKEELSSGKELTDAHIVGKLRKAAESRRAVAEQYLSVGNESRAQLEILEAEVLEGYLPTEKSKAETRELVWDIIAETGVTNRSGMGIIMKALKNQDDVNMKVASLVVKELLQ